MPTTTSDPGWRGALLAFLVLAGSAGASESMTCRGNEPFWSLEIGEQTATYAALGEPPITLRGEARALDYLGVQVWRGRAAGDARDWIVVVETDVCVDTMADRTFPVRGLVSGPDGRLLPGCCGEPVATRAKDPATDWSAYLLDFLPAIDACLAAVDGTAVVTKAWPMNRGLVGVRLVDAERRRFDCLAPHEGGEPVAYDTVEDASARLPGEFQPRFARAPATPPSGECYHHEEVRDPETGVRLGWLSYNVC